MTTESKEAKLLAPGQIRVKRETYEKYGAELLIKLNKSSPGTIIIVKNEDGTEEEIKYKSNPNSQ